MLDGSLRIEGGVTGVAICKSQNFRCFLTKIEFDFASAIVLIGKFMNRSVFIDHHRDFLVYADLSQFNNPNGFRINQIANQLFTARL